MAEKNEQRTIMDPSSLMARAAMALTALMAVAALSASAREEHYRQVNLVSDQPGVAMLQDTNLVNAWGISFGPTNPFWVSDNGTGLATLYMVTNDAAGSPHVSKLGLQVAIPGDGSVDGQLFDGNGSFNGDIFLFVSEDGTISGWRPALGTMAETLTMNTNATYKGVALTMTAAGPTLLAANFRTAKVDAYDTNMTLVAQFSDPQAPDGYAPFNVQSIHGMIFVTYAKQDADHHDDVAGPGNGLIDVLNPDTGMFHRLATGSDAGGHLREINSPWGVTLAPEHFGKHGGELLVGNFGSGTIMTFDPDGKFRGFLKGRHEGPIVIDGLWGLTLGNGTKAGVPDTLYFTAGPDGESHGLFGSLVPGRRKR